MTQNSPPTSEESAEAPKSESDLRADTTSAWGPLEALFRLRALESFRHRDFRLLWFGHVFTSMAFWMDQVTRGWLIY